MKASLTIAGCLLLLGISGPADAVVITLDPSATVVDYGDAFSVDVLASDIAESDPLLAFGFNVTAHPALSYLGATVGPMFFDDSASYPTDVAGSAFPPVFGDGILLASLDFAVGPVVEAEVLTVSLTTDPVRLGLSEGLITLLSDIAIDEVVEVSFRRTDAAPVPEPGTLWLLSIGVVVSAAAAVRRRRRGEDFYRPSR